MSKLISIVKVVQQVQDKQWIPEGMPQAITFFSEEDVWQHHGVFDERICEVCIEFQFQIYHGNALREVFPYLEIVDIDRIDIHAHMPRDDNCRCWLSRVYE